MQKIGFIGIGNMGWGMAANVAKAGFELMVFDTDAARCARFSAEHGVPGTSRLADLAGSDVIVTMLPTGKIVREVMTAGDGGGLGALLKRGAVLVDMSSSEPIGTRELAQLLAPGGVVVIDAPVSGGVQRANSGNLSIMVGADDIPALEVVTPLLNAMGDRVFITGGLGCGHAMKALNNYVASACFAATAEAMLIGERFGLDQGTMVEIMNVSTGRNFFTDMVMKEHVVGAKFNTGFAVGLLAKDVKIAAELGIAVGQAAPVLDLVCERWAYARDTLGANRDNTEAILAWKTKDAA